MELEKQNIKEEVCSLFECRDSEIESILEKMPDCKVSEMFGPLYTAYKNWIKKGDSFSEEKLLKQVDKVISQTLSKNKGNFLPYDFSISSLEDFRQDLRLVVFSRLRKVTNPTNKRLYNYIRYTVWYHLILSKSNMAKMSTRKKDMYEKNTHTLRMSERATKDYTEFDIPDFKDERLNLISNMILDRYSKVEIARELGIKEKNLETLINRMRKFYPEQNEQWKNRTKRSYTKKL